MNREIIDGIVVFDENDNPVGKSKKAAVKGITQVVVSRVAMAAPGMSEFRARQIKIVVNSILFCRKRPCISRTFFHKIEAKNGECSLSMGTSVFGVLKNLINIHKTS